MHYTRRAGAIAKLVGAKNVEDFWRGSRGGTPPRFWTTTASALLQVIEIKGDAKDTPVDQGVDHVDHPWPSPKQSVWRPLHSGEATATSAVRIVVVADIPLTPVNQLPDQGTRGFHSSRRSPKSVTQDTLLTRCVRRCAEGAASRTLIRVPGNSWSI